jgi:tRNA (guanine37-N1)-methyltransferase
MNFVVLTIFPDMCRPFWEHGIVRRAVEQKKISVDALDIREYAQDRHKMTDDRPYGGGCGMVMKPEPLAGAIRSAKEQHASAKVVLLSPQGRAFDQPMAEMFTAMDGLIFVCGRYEGVDERICQDLVDYEVSIGDFVLTGGELGALVIIDAVTRLIPGTLGGEDSAALESFSDGLLEHAHYTRPPVFENEAVPDVLLSGHHKEIEKWRQESALAHTFVKRQDLLGHRCLNAQEIDILKRWHRDLERIIHAQALPGTDPLSSGQ